MGDRSTTAYLHELTRALIALDTVSSRSNAAAAALLAERLEGHGFRVRLHETDDAGTAKVDVIAVAGPDEPDGLVVAGHVDTVPFEDQAGWNRDPLAFGADDRRVYGRGIADMKGFLAQCVAAARDLDVARLDRPLVVLFTSDEEIGCRGARRLVPALSSLVAPTPLPRLAWIGEPTSYRVFHTHKAIVLFTVTVHGRSGHSSLPEEGVNAIAVAAHVVETIGRLQAELRAAPAPPIAAEFPECPYVALNLATIHGGTAANVIPDRCVLEVSYRPLPGMDALEVYETLRRRLAAADRTDPGSPARAATIEIGEPLVVPGLLSRRGTALEAALFAVLDETASGGAAFSTDGGELARLGVDSLICGPGDLDQAHQPNESMSRAAFERGPDVIASVVRRLCTPTRSERRLG